MINLPSEKANTLASQQPAQTIIRRYLPLLGRLTPPLLMERAVSIILNQALLSALQGDALRELSGRWLAIDCSDWPYPIRLSRSGCRLSVSTERGPVDASIRGDTDSFLMLLRQEVDPDTLFFQRKLSMQGDTELALAVKNFLDSVEPTVLPVWLRQLIGKQ